jgi:C4-dicarboxylate-specific signal transduction histidine kinase
VETPDSFAAALERVAIKAEPKIRAELLKLASRARESAERQEATYKRFLDGYSDLAALGQAAIGLSRSLHPQLEMLRKLGNRIRDEAPRSNGHFVQKHVDDLEQIIAILSDRIAMVGPMETDAKHRRRALDVASEAAVFSLLMEPVLRAAGAEMKIIADPAEVIRIEMRPETFHRLLHILGTNSLDWLQGIREPRISIVARTADRNCEIIFSDNGPGIAPGIAERVFEPTFSGKEGGRGMGLTIARNLVVVHGGQIDVLTDGRRRGANIRILLPRKRSRATVH